MRASPKPLARALLCALCAAVALLGWGCGPVKPKARTQAAMRDYPSILEEYRLFAEVVMQGRLEAQFEADWTFDENEMSEPLSSWYGIMDGVVSFLDGKPTREDFGYAQKDLNGDGIDELILLLKEDTVLAIFSTVDGVPKLLDHYWPRHKCAIEASGLLYTLGSSGAADWEYALRRITREGALMFVEQYGSSRGGEMEQREQFYYKIIDGEQTVISKAEFEKFQESHPPLSMEIASEITKASGIVFLPLFP